MHDLPPGWATDLAILRLTGSSVEDRGDHLVVRTPANPTYHWGNCLLVLDGRLDDAAHWVRTFAATFPEARWVALGLPRLPDDPEPWRDLGLAVELDDVLTTTKLPRLSPVPEGYAVRALAGDADWEQHVALELRENERTGEYPGAYHERFVRTMTQTRRGLCEAGDAAWFGAFADAALVADLGIVRCGDGDARYQSVGTDAEHRRRGLAGHLLGVAARWAADRGARRWVIVTEATNPAGRVYRSVGFAPDRGSAQAYRRPPAAGAPVG